MKIIKNLKDNDNRSIAFNSIVDIIIEEFNININSFDGQKNFLVSLNGKPGGDYSFDYEKFISGEIGIRFLVKEIANKIFHLKLDPRGLSNKIIAKYNKYDTKR